MSTTAMHAMRMPNDVLLITFNAWEEAHSGQAPDTYALALTKPMVQPTPDRIWDCFEVVANHIHQGTQ